MPFYNRDKPLQRFEMVQRSRNLRHQATEAERFVWLRLNRRQIGGVNFRRQHPIGPYIVDFYCPKKKLVIELDGEQHGEAEGKLHDLERTRYLEGYGIRVLRYWNGDVFKNWEGIKQDVCKATGTVSLPWHSLPQPSSHK